MKNTLYLITLLVALSLVGVLYYKLTITEAALKVSEQHFHDCQQVTFQLQNQLSAQANQGVSSPSE